jgi:hypothetical protein
MASDSYGLVSGYNQGEILRQQAKADQEWIAKWKVTTHLPPMQPWQLEAAAKEALANYKEEQQQQQQQQQRQQPRHVYDGGRRMRYKSTRRRGKTNRRRVKTHRRRHRKH